MTEKNRKIKKEKKKSSLFNMAYNNTQMCLCNNMPIACFSIKQVDMIRQLIF